MYIYIYIYAYISLRVARCLLGCTWSNEATDPIHSKLPFPLLRSRTSEVESMRLINMKRTAQTTFSHMDPSYPGVSLHALHAPCQSTHGYPMYPHRIPRSSVCTHDGISRTILRLH